MYMNTNDVRQLIRDEIRHIGVTAFAKAGVTRAYVYAALNGQREPRGGILAAIGVEKFVGYRRMKIGAQAQ